MIEISLFLNIFIFLLTHLCTSFFYFQNFKTSFGIFHGHSLGYICFGEISNCICYSVFQTAAWLGFEKRMLAFLKPSPPFYYMNQCFWRSQSSFLLLHYNAFQPDIRQQVPFYFEIRSFHFSINSIWKAAELITDSF